MDRRRALALCAAASGFGAAGARPLLLGAPLFIRTDDPREMAREARRLGYSAAYWPPAAPHDAARLRAIEAGFAAENVVLAEVGVWVNLMDADGARRKENLQKSPTGWPWPRRWARAAR